MVDLNEMAMFAVVAKEGSFTRAAKQLGMAKSTLSRKVAALEERLGVRLLQRTSRQMSLTEVGQAYYERCTRLVADAQEADLAVSAFADTPQGLLRVTTPKLFADAFMGPIADALLRRHPDLSLEVLATNERVNLVEAGYDLAIRAGNLPDSTLIARKLGAANSALVASPRYLARFGRPERIEDLRDHRCLVSDEAQAVWRFHRGGRDVSIAVTGHIVTNSWPLMLAMAEAGHGIARLPAFLVLEMLRDGRLEQLELDEEPTAASVYAVYPSSRQLSAKVRAFIDLVVDHFVDAPPWTGRLPLGHG